MRKSSIMNGSPPTVTKIEQALAEGNCGRATDRGEEACECARKYRPVLRRRSHSQQNCKVTNRNHIQGRNGQASVPCNTKPLTSNRSGKCGTCAAKLKRLIQGDLLHVPERKLASSRGDTMQILSCRAEVSRRRSTDPQIPLRSGRPER